MLCLVGLLEKYFDWLICNRWSSFTFYDNKMVSKYKKTHRHTAVSSDWVSSKTKLNSDIMMH